MEGSMEQLKKQRRRMGVSVGILAFVTLTSFVYAFVQREIAKVMAQETERLHIKLDQCTQAAQEQMKMAEKNAMEAKRQNQRAEEALKKASKK